MNIVHDDGSWMQTGNFFVTMCVQKIECTPKLFRTHKLLPAVTISSTFFKRPWSHFTHMGNTFMLTALIGGTVMLIWFPVVYIIGFAVSYGNYKKASNVLGERQPPEKVYVAVHWTMMVGGILMGGGILLLRYMEIAGIATMMLACSCLGVRGSQNWFSSSAQTNTSSGTR